ncbi:MAG: LemA family protein [Gemmatimonadota bacterium]|nr:MAG: LemA family protein [Gemmatimonadota bacterium]
MNGVLVGGTIAAALFLMWAVITYNRFVGLRRHIQESWADIDVELKRRYELIPNLVATVKGYAEYERETVEQVVELRAKAMENHGSAVSQALDESALMIGLKRMFAVVEGYPELKADTHYMALQKELANTEDRIAAARRFYNGNVRELNVLLESFPAGIIGRRFNFEAATFFELDSAAERVVPRIAS